jgi:hypothetical protein
MPAGVSRILEDPVEFKAFSGANIYATIGHRRVASLQAVTVSITREVAALYSFSDANPKAFVKGKRGIAGTLVFTQYDRHALLQDIFKEAFGEELGKTSSLFSTRFAGADTGAGLLSAEAFSTRNFDHQVGSNAALAFPGGVARDLQSELSDIYDLVKHQRLKYSDQIPEFDINITMVNESGDAAFVVIGGVVLVNEGWGYTLDDLTSEVAFTYVARAITPLTSLTNDGLFERYKRDGSLNYNNG